MNTQHIQATMQADGNVTLVTLTMGDLTVLGSAKRGPGDKNNPQIGADLAMVRALRVLAGKLERRANGAVQHAEWVKSDRRRRAAVPASRRRRSPATTSVEATRPL